MDSDPTVKSDQKDHPEDSKNAVTEATDALQTLIAKYRSHAESLPADTKEKVKMITLHIPCNKTHSMGHV